MIKYLPLIFIVGCTWFDPRNTVSNYTCNEEQQSRVDQYIKECKTTICDPMPFCKNKAVINFCEYKGPFVNP